MAAGLLSRVHTHREWLYPILAFVLAAVLILPLLGSFGLWSPHEFAVTDAAGEAAHDHTIGKLGENMAVPRFVRYAGGGYVAQYIHMGGKIGVQVEFQGVTPAVAARNELTTLTKEIAMQVAAASPGYASRQAIPADVLEKEKAIYRAQMEGSGKPANVIDKIVEGKLGSFYAQVVLPDQPSIRDVLLFPVLRTEE